MKKTKLLIVIVLAIIAVGAIIGYLQYNKPHKNYEKLKADYSFNATELVGFFENDETEANNLYLNKMIEVNGNPVSHSKLSNGMFTISLYDDLIGVTCTFDSAYVANNSHLFKNIQQEKSISIKGRCDGYLTDVKLSKCSFVDP